MRIGFHDVAIARVSHQDEFPSRIGLEDFIEQVFADTERSRYVAEIEGSSVKGAARVGLVDEVHVIASDLLGGRRQVVEMDVWDGTRPIGVDLGHVFPLDEGAGEGIKEAFFGLVNLRYAEDIIDVANDGKSGGRNEIGGCIADVATFGVYIQTLDVGSAVAIDQTVAFYLDKSVEVALGCCRIRESDSLIPTIGCHGSASTLFSGCSGCGRRTEVEGNILVILLENKNARSKIPRLGLLLRG